MNSKLKKNIGFSLLPFAFIFLFEPGYTIIDPLPDCIGYAIMCFALSNLSDINPRVEEAFTGFRKGILINIMRMIAIFLLNSYFIESELSVGLLLFVFIFSFFELFVMIPSYRCLFEGLLSLGLVHDGNAVYYKKLRKVKRLDGNGNEYTEVIESKRNLTEKAYFITVAFLCIKNFAVVLPEFTTLSTNNSYEFVSVLRFFGMLIALTIGIVWLIKMIRYVSAIRKDSPFIQNLSQVFLNNLKEKPNYYTVKNISVGLFFLMLATALSIDFYSNYVDLIPDFVYYVIIAASAVFLKRFSRKWRILLISGTVGSIIAAFSHYTTVSFYDKYTPLSVTRELDAYYGFYKMLGMQIAESAVMICTIILVLLLLRDIYMKHTDIGISTNPKERAEYKKRFVFYAVFIGILGAVTAIGSIYYVYAQPFSDMQNWLYYYSAIISIFINLIYVFAMCYFIGFVSNSVKYRYRLDI